MHFAFSSNIDAKHGHTPVHASTRQKKLCLTNVNIDDEIGDNHDSRFPNLVDPYASLFQEPTMLFIQNVSRTESERLSKCTTLPGGKATL